MTHTRELTIDFSQSFNNHSPMYIAHKAIAMVVVCFFVAGNLHAGALGDFEDNVRENAPTNETTPKVEPVSETPGVRGYDRGQTSWFGALINSLLYGFLSAAYDGSSMSGKERLQYLRDTGSAALPYIRLEAAYQKTFDDVQGYDINLNAGYLNFAADFDFLHYFESNPNDQLKFISTHGILRMAPSPIFQVDLALGAKIIQGRGSRSGFEIGMPFYIYVSPYLYFDVKSYGAFIKGKDLYDVSVGVNVKYKNAGIRVAYRTIDLAGDSLHGPHIGLFFQW
jgi:hypothetical protein